MFRSVTRPLVFPQTEHLRLAGTVARAWGNSLFAVPEIGHNRFGTAVEAHDRGYGELDTWEVSRTPIPDWVACRRRGLEMHCADPAVDILTALHSKTLMNGLEFPECKTLASDCEKEIVSLLSKQLLPRSSFDRMYSVMRVCDAVSYYFCFETPTVQYMNVYCNAACVEPISMEIRIDGGGRATLDPWPLSTACIDSTLLGYEADVYPHRLFKTYVPFSLQRTNAVTKKIRGEGLTDAPR